MNVCTTAIVYMYSMGVVDQVEPSLGFLVRMV